MTAEEAVDGEGEAGVCRRGCFPLDGQVQSGADAAGTADQQLAFLFSVDVDEAASSQQSRIQREGPVHAGFL